MYSNSVVAQAIEQILVLESKLVLKVAKARTCIKLILLKAVVFLLLLSLELYLAVLPILWYFKTDSLIANVQDINLLILGIDKGAELLI